MRRGDGFPGHTIGDSSAIAPGGCADAARQCDDGTGRRSGVACGPQPGTPSPSGVALDSVGVGDIDAEPLSDGVDAAAHRSRAEVAREPLVLRGCAADEAHAHARAALVNLHDRRVPPARGTPRVRLVRGEGRGVST